MLTGAGALLGRVLKADCVQVLCRKDRTTSLHINDELLDVYMLWVLTHTECIDRHMLGAARSVRISVLQHDDSLRAPVGLVLKALPKATEHMLTMFLYCAGAR